MMHRVKKSFHKHTARKDDLRPSGQFQDYHTRLDVVKRNITLLDNKMTEANNVIMRLMVEQRSFSEKFAEGYPIDLDETHAVAVEFRHGIEEVYDYYVRRTSPEVASYRKMHEQVKAYLREIAEVEAMYPALTDARAEVSRYQKKVDGIFVNKEMKGKPNADLKKTRNLEKLDAERERLEQLTQTVVIAQKRTYAKAPLVHKLALCAYWVAYRTHLEIMTKSMEKTDAFTSANEEEMLQVEVAKINTDYAVESSPYNLPESPIGSAVTASPPMNTMGPNAAGPSGMPIAATAPGDAIAADVAGAPRTGVPGRASASAKLPQPPSPGTGRVTPVEVPSSPVTPQMGAVPPAQLTSAKTPAGAPGAAPPEKDSGFRAKTANRFSKIRLGPSKASTQTNAAVVQ